MSEQDILVETEKEKKVTVASNTSDDKAVEDVEETSYTPWHQKHNFYPKIPVNPIKEFLDGKEHLDIYQLFAFRTIINPNPLSNIQEKLKESDENYEIPKEEWMKARLIHYWSHLFKFILCILACFISIVSLYFNIFDMSQQSERGWCSMNGAIQSKLAAIIYTILVGTCFSSLLWENQHAGFYWQLSESYLGAFPS
eukprot:849811_1